MDNNEREHEQEYQPNSEDEEYEYQPEGQVSTSAYAPTEEQKTNVLERVKRKNIFALIGVIIAIYVIYKIVSFLFTHDLFSRHIQKTTTVTQSTVSATPAQPPAPSLATQVSNLAQQNANNQQTLSKLDTQLQDVQNSLFNINVQLSNLSSAVQTIQANIAAQQAAAEAAKQAQEALQKRRLMRAKHAVPKPVYFVRAMIPGRAWLTTGGGGTLTVSTGDNLPGYGTVEAIDPNQGIITTSAGAIIGYNPGDR